jgi:hypothetical protein
MIITAFRAGPSLASTGLLPDCTVLCTRECTFCGLAYIVILTGCRRSADQVCDELLAHFALLSTAITSAHDLGHPFRRLSTDGQTVEST